jgi:hypothetical protein
MSDDFWPHVLGHFDLPIDQRSTWSIVPYAKRHGYSNTRIWRVDLVASRAGALVVSEPGPAIVLDEPKETMGRTWCLRRWPLEEPGAGQLRWIHEQLLIAQSTCPFILVPVPTCRHGQTFVEFAGHLWQLELWASGRNDFHSAPSPKRLVNVMSGLANLHLRWLGHDSEIGNVSTRHHPLRPPSGRQMGPSIGLQRRLAQMELWLGSAETIFEQSWQYLGRFPTKFGDSLQSWRSLVDEIQQYWNTESINALDQLVSWQQVPLPVGPVLADVWSDHLFFADDALTTIIDYGAMRVDTVAADLSRCLSSLCGQDDDARGLALRAYEEKRPLSPTEKVAIDTFDRTSRLLGPFHWLRWLFSDERTAPSDSLLRRLQCLLEGRPF